MNKLHNKKLFLLDMDGTIYLDQKLFDGTKEFLKYINSHGGKYIFLTNNSSKSVDAYIEKLENMGIKSEKKDFLTSIDAMIFYLKTKKTNKKYYVFGTESFKKQLIDAEIIITSKLEDDIEGLITGFDTELSFKKLEDACILLNKDIEYYATNPDWVCPTWYGYVPDCGSVCEMLFRATGKRPKVIGKPQPDMVNIAIEQTGYKKEEAVLIGDRIYTDIACGNNADIDTVLVLSGESTLKDLEANKEIEPTFIYDNIKSIYEEMAKN